MYHVLADFRAIAKRFPDMTLGDLSDLCWLLGVCPHVRLQSINRDRFLWDAWQRKAKRERGEL